MHKTQNFKSVREMLCLIQNMALECFEQFDTRLDKTPELRDWIISNICIQFKNLGVIRYFFKYSLNARKEIKDKIDNLALGLIGKFELSKLLNIDSGDIHYLDNKFCIFRYSDTKLKIEHFNFALSNYKLHFKDCDFENFDIENEVRTQYADLCFERCNFFDSILFAENRKCIEQNIVMKDCIFYKEVIMANKNFDVAIYFNNSTFKDCVDFHESIFNQTACFYGVTFEKPPNFSQTIFNGNLNLVNSNLSFDFDECKSSVNVEYDKLGQPIKIILRQRIIHKDKIANNFRDSFRICKNISIKENNLLDASNYHKIELYFKEIELDSKKPKIFSKEWIDLWQLKLYRLTSNHHTDLLRIFSLLVILIGCFATTLFFIKDYGNPKIWYGIFWATFGVILIFTAFGKIRYLGFFTLLSFVPCAWLVSYNPKFIFGVASLFGNNNCNGIFLNFTFSIYTILFILLIFSLQKTARKNSIIPS